MWPFTRTLDRTRIDALQREIEDLERRSLAIADINATKLPTPQFTQWTIERSVRSAYQTSGWVYLAVTKIMNAGSSVPFVAKKTDDDSIDWDHPVTQLLQHPNPVWSRQNWTKLIISWLGLGGNGYCQRIISGGRTLELWPISPDIMAPVLSSDPMQLVSRYQSQDGRIKFDPEEVIHFRLIDPANPAIGLSPLQAAGRAVDTDIELANFNKVASQNRGVLDGLIMLKGAATQNQANTLAEKLTERMTRLTDRFNIRRPAVIAADGEYVRIGQTPAELDFLGGRAFSRDEIYQIYGIPLVLMGVAEASTYNNMETAPRTFWRETMIPLLVSMADDIDYALRQEVDDLGDTHYIAPDLSSVPALKEDQERTAKIFAMYVAAGVPPKNANDLLQAGIEEFDGWDMPYSGTKQPPPAGERGAAVTANRRYRIRDNRQDVEIDALLSEQITTGPGAELWGAIFEQQQAAVFAAVEAGGDAVAALESVRADVMVALDQYYLNQGLVLAGSVVVETRDAPSDASISDRLIDLITDEVLALRVLSEADEITARMIGEQLSDLISQGATIGEMQQAIIDAGVFSPERALMLARTTTTQAQSLGLLAAADAVGAQTKTWVTAGLGVRDTHRAANGQTVEFRSMFSVPSPTGGTESARYPGDPNLSIANRANCRCSLRFSTRPLTAAS